MSNSFAEFLARLRGGDDAAAAEELFGRFAHQLIALLALSLQRYTTREISERLGRAGRTVRLPRGRQTIPPRGEREATAAG
jgi:hypothetical protein